MIPKKIKIVIVPEVMVDCIVDSRIGLSVVSSTVCGFFVVGD